MAIDRQVIWCYRRHVSYPHIKPGFAFASAAEKAAMIAASCADDLDATVKRYMTHIMRVPPYDPETPQDLAATPAGATQVNLTWSDVNSAPNEDSYEIQRKTGVNGAWGALTTTAADATSHSDTTAEASTTYFYRIRANFSASDSTWSAPVSATTPAS